MLSKILMTTAIALSLHSLLLNGQEAAMQVKPAEQISQMSTPTGTPAEVPTGEPSKELTLPPSEKAPHVSPVEPAKELGIQEKEPMEEEKAVKEKPVEPEEEITVVEEEKAESAGPSALTEEELEELTEEITEKEERD